MKEIESKQSYSMNTTFIILLKGGYISLDYWIRDWNPTIFIQTLICKESVKIPIVNINFKLLTVYWMKTIKVVNWLCNQLK